MDPERGHLIVGVNCTHQRGFHQKPMTIDHLNGAPTVEINATVVATAIAIRIEV
jgi:hypothetical protein